MRAIETGIPVARSANTGISAVISANGKIIDSLPLETQGSLKLAIPQALKPTFYFTWGDSIFLMMILSLITMRLIVKRYY
jgi:Apolipoprotein N-acyltransferase